MMRFVALLTGCCLFVGAGPAANAQSSPSAAEIIERLKGDAHGDKDATGAPQRRTRGLRPPQPDGAPVIVGPASAPSGYGAPPPAPVPPPAAATAPPSDMTPENRVVVDQLFKTPRPKFNATQRQQAAAVARLRPAIDLTVYFDFDSAQITPKAKAVLIELGKALASDDLSGRRFLVAGHTDAKGSANYNQALSERRAAAIKRYLEREFSIAPGRLLAVGFGEEQLKNTIDPNAGDNRRVQVVNLGR
ncbi:MAG: OmpA family protein [Hyphomicrobiaceae bacterium]